MCDLQTQKFKFDSQITVGHSRYDVLLVEAAQEHPYDAIYQVNEYRATDPMRSSHTHIKTVYMTKNKFTKWLEAVKSCQKECCFNSFTTISGRN